MKVLKGKMVACVFRVFVLVILGCFLISCGGGRYIKEPSTPPEIGITSSNDDLNVTLNCLICSNTPGSWIKDAPWHEYIVTIKTPAEKSLTIYKVSLIDPTGVERICGQHPGLLQKESEILLKTYKDMGLLTAGGGVSTAAAAASTVSTSTSFLSVVPFIGPALSLAGMGAVHGGTYADAKDRENIQAEFQKRKLGIPLSLSDNANVRGSIFFPLIPNPKALVMEYRLKDDMQSKTLKMPLEKIEAK